VGLWKRKRPAEEPTDLKMAGCGQK